MSVLSAARVETAFWALLCGGLAAGIGAESDWGRQIRLQAVVPEPVAEAFHAPPLTEPFSMPAPDELMEMALRPPFVATRRPSPPPPPPEAPKPTMQRGQFLLQGVSVVAGAKFAFIREKASNKSFVLTEGKTVNGIQIREIHSDRVVLSQYDESEVLTLQTAKVPVQAVAASVPTSAASIAGATSRVSGEVPQPGGVPSVDQTRPPVIGPPPILPSDLKK